MSEGESKNFDYGKRYYAYIIGSGESCGFNYIGCGNNLKPLKSNTFEDATKEVFNLLGVGQEDKDEQGLGYDMDHKYPIENVIIIEATKLHQFDIDGYYEKRDATAEQNKLDEKEKSERDQYKRLKAKFDGVNQ